ILHVSFSNSFGLASARPTPQGLSGAPENFVTVSFSPLQYEGLCGDEGKLSYLSVDLMSVNHTEQALL
ncbi:MAG: hypothetical protein UFI53_07325, partial [Hallella sp.]|uniref:hypothetical protein n=1 Tax=Hallella sp. TaxID=2980186 RepID=UPI002E783E0F